MEGMSTYDGQLPGPGTLLDGRDLNDENQTLRMEDPHGSYLMLSPNVVRLHSETALEIEAPGKSIAIEAATIDFRRRS